MEKTTQQILGDITERSSIIGKDVIMEYVNRQHGCCDKSFMSSAAGRLEEVTEDGIRVSQDFVPFAGPLASICSIKRVGNNRLLYSNPSAYETYTNNPIPLSKERIRMIEQRGRWFIK